MYRVFISREERGDALLVAKDVINEAIFDRQAANFGLQVLEDPAADEDNSVGYLVETAEEDRLRSFLTSMVPMDMPCLVVTVPADELEKWEADDLNRHYSFEADDQL